MTAPISAKFAPIGDLLLAEGRITREQLDRALADHREHGTRLGATLVRLGFISEHDLARAVARQHGMPAVDLSTFEADPKLVQLVPAELARTHLVLPLKRDGRTLTVAMVDPSNLGVIEDLTFITRCDIFPVIAGELILKTLVDQQYGVQDATQMSALLTALEDVDVETDIEVMDAGGEETAAGAAASLDDAPVVKLINALLFDAVKRGASDIHFECFEHDLRVRYRIDGALVEVMKPPKRLQSALISRFKIMASLNIAERRVPQDGRIRLKMGRQVIDFRVATLPTLFGEKVVLRILDKGNLTLELERFGIEPRAEQELMDAIANPYGMVLVTGPTGSGKTTTLYSCLSKVNAVDTNIMSAEDPVEYNLYGVNQVQVRAEIGMTFAAALRAFLRQDPNIIMVGEIRDPETGGIAIKAALTGHLVLSTLHTNSAAESVTRLLDMGLEPFNVSSALNLVVAQRLVRRICSGCKTPVVPDPSEFAGARLGGEATLRDLHFTEVAIRDLIARAPRDVAARLASVTLDTPVREMPYYRGRGCDACGGSGLKGRQGIYEVMGMTADLRKRILQQVAAAELRDAAVATGMLTLRMDGLLKVWKGITTLEQVVRETSA
jgi:type IV pilus assembly protein PilB